MFMNYIRDRLFFRIAILYGLAAMIGYCLNYYMNHQEKDPTIILVIILAPFGGLLGWFLGPDFQARFYAPNNLVTQLIFQLITFVPLAIILDSVASSSKRKAFKCIWYLIIYLLVSAIGYVVIFSIGVKDAQWFNIHLNR